MYSAIDVAKYVIWYCSKKGYAVSNLKLQKMLYFIQAEFLVKRSSRCFIDRIEAWGLGPVVPRIYDEYKKYGSAEIPSKGFDTASMKIKRTDQARINKVVDKCSKYSASALVEITHRQDPWKRVYRKYENNEITPDSIRAYFA